jgi:K+-sensing histidine kinase KdpD
MNEAFRLLFDQVKSGVVWVQRDGVVRYANKAAVQMTPVMLGQPMMDPVAESTVVAAAQGMLKLPFSFELTTQEVHPDAIRAVVIDAPVGHDLMAVLNNVSQERWYSQALENLIGYIEAEMAQPIDALYQKLPKTAQLVQQQGASVDLKALVQEAAALSVKLGELIDQSLAEVMPLAKARNITLTLAQTEHEMPAIYGSSHWLGKAMSEYLEQSVRSGQPGDLIELTVQTVGAHVMVRARNQGLFVSGHERRNAYVPFGVGDSASAPEQRRGIGLALAQRILEQHGGSVRIEDEFDSVDFVLEIPAGAPAAQDAQLSVEQAQRYARDMSQLLATSMAKRVQVDDKNHVDTPAEAGKT